MTYLVIVFVLIVTLTDSKITSNTVVISIKGFISQISL